MALDHRQEKKWKNSMCQAQELIVLIPPLETFQPTQFLADQTNKNTSD